MRSIVNGKTTYNVYDAGGKAIARDVLGGTTYYTFSNHLGSPVATMNGMTGAIDRERYTPFGITLNNPSVLDDQVGFTGHIKERDKIDPVNQFLLSATGLNPCIFYSKNCTVQARYYDPVMGRFLSIDPVTFLDEKNPGYFNRYSYTFNDPINMIDPDGERVVFAPGSSPQFKKQFAGAIQYLNTHKISGTFARLESSSSVVTIQEGSNHAMSFNPGNDTITWDTTSGLDVGGGNVQTPALGLLHEAGHVEAHLNNPVQENTDFNTPNSQYTNDAEQKVITNLETPSATKAGEPTRNNHGGTPVRVSCETCTK